MRFFRLDHQLWFSVGTISHDQWKGLSKILKVILDAHLQLILFKMATTTANQQYPVFKQTVS